MTTINTFKDWWHKNSENIDSDNWWESFRDCWETAQGLELQRCASLSAHRLVLEAQVAQAVARGELQKFMSAQESMEKMLRGKDE